jgi:cytidylate kinase
MPVVTISRQFGAGGSSVAGIVAAELHAEVVDKKLIEEVARRLQISPNEVAAEDERPRPLLERLVRSFSTLEPTMGAGWSPPYPDPLFDPRNAIIQLTEEVIREVADGGNVVIVGRGAGFCLRDRPNVFRVFLRAPEAVRVKTLMERFGLTEADARRKMHETDANRAAYTHQLYKRDWCDPDGYDLIVNTGRLGYQATSEVILRGLREPLRMAVPVA